MARVTESDGYVQGKSNTTEGPFQTTFDAEIPWDGVTSISLFLDVETERQHLSSKRCWLAQKLAFRPGGARENGTGGCWICIISKEFRVK